jgi:hypothetical protein
MEDQAIYKVKGRANRAEQGRSFQKIMCSLEFDFDLFIRETISQNRRRFINLCKRYPNDADLGARIRELTNEIKKP